ncbi:MAG: hypothetical protein AB8B81_03530 [Halioglobus sp.]
MTRVFQHFEFGCQLVASFVGGCALFLLVAVVAVAQEPITESNGGDEQIADAGTPSAEESAEVIPETTESEKTFEPTEDISEDISISFPIDI